MKKENSSYGLLLKIQLYGMFGINRLLHSHDSAEKRRFIATGTAASVCVVLLIYISGLMSITLAKSGLEQLLPPLLLAVYSLLVLFLTFLKSFGTLTGAQDYDMVMSLPVSSASIVLSRLTMLYLTNVAAGLAVISPAVIVYEVYSRQGILMIVVLTVFFLLAPVFPMILALTAGVFITAFSARTKHGGIISFLLGTGAIIIFAVMCMKVQSMDESVISDAGMVLADHVERLYPPARFVSDTLYGHDWSGFLLFLSGTAAATVVFTVIISRFYKALNTSVFSKNTGKKLLAGNVTAASPFTALYKKEIARFFSCTIYALNSSIIMALLLITAAAVSYGADTVAGQMEAAGLMERFEALLPFLLSVPVSMSCTTSASLSLEGKNRWLMCSMPVRTETIFASKIAVNLTVAAPMLLISAMFFRAAFPLSAAQTVFLFLTPMGYALFIAVAGMCLNVKFPRYDWKNEYYAVKGGAVFVLATVGTGLVSSAAPLYLSFIFTQWAQEIVAVSTAAVFAFSVLGWRWLKTVRLYMC